VLASEYQDGSIDASLDEIAFRIHVTREELEAGLKPLIDAGFFISDSAMAQDASKALAEPEHDASELVQSATLEKRREEEETEKNISTVASATRRNEHFEEFWRAYPRRDGANPKEPAAKLFHAAVKAGEDPDRIIAGARRCVAVEAKNIGTPYIPQAVKWLRDKRWRDYLAEAEQATQALSQMFYAKADSEQLAAWDQHARSLRGKGLPRDRNGGWYVPAEWPPGYQPKGNSAPPPVIAMQSMHH
jgi:hypothetical protein